jgi:hypothetical protein
MIPAVIERCAAPIPFVTPEDILLAKLYWFKAGGEISSVQWRDVPGILRNRSQSFDNDYARRSAEKIGVSYLLEKAVADASPPISTPQAPAQPRASDLPSSRAVEDSDRTE